MAERLNRQLVERALRMDGTCTGEHGIGLHKMDFLISEAGTSAVSMMRKLKQALDPKNIMNPGKIFANVSGRRTGCECVARPCTRSGWEVGA